MQKSTARNIFIFGTVFFFLIFFGLSAHTISVLPERTNEQDLTPEVIAGKKVWEKNNCVNCHTLIGEGAYYATEVMQTYQKRGPDWLRAFFKDPVKTWYGSTEAAQGQRKMPKANLSDKDINNLIAFLEWVGRIDTNYWPPEPVGTLVTDTAEPAENLIKMKNCRSCHVIKGTGVAIGPSLDGISQRKSPAEIEKILRDPRSVNPLATMPKLNLTDNEIEVMVDYLSRL